MEKNLSLTKWSSSVILEVYLPKNSSKDHKLVYVFKKRHRVRAGTHTLYREIMMKYNVKLFIVIDVSQEISPLDGMWQFRVGPGFNERYRPAISYKTLLSDEGTLILYFVAWLHIDYVMGIYFPQFDVKFQADKTPIHLAQTEKLKIYK